MSLDFQVVVAGGGPVGSFIATNLALHGVKTLILDRKVNDVPPICTGIIGVEMNRLIPVDGEAVHSEITAVKLHVASQRLLEYSNHGTIAYVIDRTKFDGDLLSKAMEAGVTRLRPSKLKGVEFLPPNEVKLEIATDEEAHTITANLLIVATGFSPNLLSKLGFQGYPGTTEGAQVEVPFSTNGSTIEVYFSNTLVPNGFLWVVPLGKEMARVGMVTPRNSVHLLKNALESGFLEGIATRFDPGEVRMRLLPRGPIPKTYSNGLMVVGEAAGQLKATTYGGIYYGLLCGQCAVSTALTALDLKRSGEELLATYETKWKRRIGEELSQGARWRNLFESMSDEQMVLAADIIGGDGVLNKMKSVVRFDWHRDIIGLGLAYLKKHGMGVVNTSMPGGES